jgi:hypothetical protein
MHQNHDIADLPFGRLTTTLRRSACFSSDSPRTPGISAGSHQVMSRVRSEELVPRTSASAKERYTALRKAQDIPGRIRGCTMTAALLGRQFDDASF